MTALDKTPVNTNFLVPLNFRFQLKRAPHINFFIQKATIPGVNLANIELPTVFMQIPSPGNMTWEDFTISFKIDEDFQNYLEIFNWMLELGFPDNFDQYKSIATQPLESDKGITSDITLLILNSIHNPNFLFTMQDAFPVNLSRVDLDTTNPDVTFTTATATFKYRRFYVEQYHRS